MLAHARNAFESVEGASLLKGVKYLSKAESSLLLLLVEKGELTSGKIFGLFEKTSGTALTERRLRDLLNGLEKKRFVSSKQVSMGNQGKTRSFKCVLPAGLLLKELKN